MDPSESHTGEALHLGLGYDTQDSTTLGSPNQVVEEPSQHWDTTTWLNDSWEKTKTWSRINWDKWQPAGWLWNEDEEHSNAGRYTGSYAHPIP